jgi:formylglycine-generating enzyme
MSSLAGSPRAFAHLAVATLFTLGLSPLAIASPAVQWLSVGDLDNPPGPFGSGSVGYEYRIARDEVTNAQYAQFLNARATIGDPLRLYNASMGTDLRGGITRSGAGKVSDPFVYATKPNMADKPVNYVNWYDSIRYANWVGNGGDATADTESGGYTILGGTPIPSNGNQIFRNLGATVFLPSNNEWTKAALYDPGAGYWTYGTRSDVLPTGATADANGAVSNPGPNVANYNFSADWNGQNGNVTTVGSCGPNSTSYYGLDDATGNVSEWCEDIDFSQTQPLRALRGGSWADPEFAIFDGEFASATPGIELNFWGFRLASAVPEPGAMSLAVCGTILFLRRCRARRVA